jgi:hypothetical protein
MALTAALKALAKLAERGPVRPSNADEFFRAITAAMPVKKGDIKIGDALTRYAPEEYAAMRTFLSPDKAAGYALKNGELVSVFSVPGGRGVDLAADAVRRGARQLDNYDIRGKLPELYGSVGFRETARYPFDPTLAEELSPGAFALAPDFVSMELSDRAIRELAKLRLAGKEDVLRIAQGGRGRVTRNKRAQDAAALLALASGSGVTQAQD